MALSTILRRSASRFVSGGNRFCGNLILPSASVPALRQFCSVPSLSTKDSESLVKDAKRPSLDESLVNDLISQVQSLQRDIELLRNSYNKPLSAVQEDESVVKDEGIDESESESVLNRSIDDDSSLKGIAIESSNDEGQDSESDKSDAVSNDEGKDSDSSDDTSDDSSSDDSSDDSSSDDSSDDSSSDDSSDDDSSDDSSDDGKKSSSDSDSDKSNDESLSETDDNKEDGETLPERDDNSESGDDASVPKSKENEELLKGIESEILRAKTFMELSAPDAFIPVDFPFEIRSGFHTRNCIVMTRKYEGELVEVRLNNPTIFTDRQCTDYNEKKSSAFSMDLTVLVKCLSSEFIKLELNCGARPEGISVYSASDCVSDIEVHMSELSEKLTQEFSKYLEARGVTLSTTNFMYRYMLDKENKERLRILENIQKMVA